LFPTIDQFYSFISFTCVGSMLIPEPARLLGHLRKMCRSSDGLYWNGVHSDLHPVLYVMGLVAGRIRPDVIQEITPGYFRPSDWLSVRL
uniref:hypothetical protein n=1 Tax=Escherichia coli TaxID=562 RepID=UPI0021C852CB